jgi:hypothetical protein
VLGVEIRVGLALGYGDVVILPLSVPSASFLLPASLVGRCLGLLWYGIGGVESVLVLGMIVW